MPTKLLSHLHLIQVSSFARLPSMKLGVSVPTSRAVPIFSRIFPFRLKYLGLESRAVRNELLGIRRFSTRSFPGRAGARSEFNRGNRDTERIRVSKSLIEDEGELSDWVDDLKTDSYRGRLTSEEDDSDRETGRTGGRSRASLSMKGSREIGSSRFGESTRRRTRDTFESLSRNSRMNRRFEDEDDKEETEFRSWRPGRVSEGRNAKSLLGKRSGEELRRGRRDGKRKSYSMSEDDADEDEQGAKNFMGRFGDLISEDSDAEDTADEYDDDDLPKKTSDFQLGREKELKKSSPTRGSPERSDNYLSETKFDQCSISPLSLKGVKAAGYEKMTIVQEATLPVILRGKDVLAKAKTGTGKTVAFLLPSIEVVAKSPPVDRDQKRPPILVLVICPTRELASQAAAEATKLLKYHPSIGVQVVIGGTRLALEQKRMQANPCQILVATPGRLRDHIENTAGFATRLMGVKVLVLDEADHLLDMGFRKDIEKIIAAVPKQRQTLMFSATVPEEVRQVCHIALRRDHEFINTVEEGTEETHSQVQQMHLVAPLDKHFSLLYVLLKEHIADDIDYKVLVFCTTAMVTRLVADLLGELNLNVREIHSRKPQSYRTRVSEEFRKSKGLILVTSDVSARGVDYPDVTLVIQLGLPAVREQYIHRLGRTGRKGKEGQGILLLGPWEEFFLSTVKDLPITKAPVPSIDPDTKKKVERALSHVEMKNKEAAYQAWLGYYNSNKKVGKDKYRLVELANEFSRSMGLDNPPAIPKLVLGKMGLRNVPGLRSK
ncbi:DEAD-box ATP-dependent RNA helicase 31 [Neltuma alba]|uniref:DEAD-box ATP-dependent RNA helicase 31 n=1 Tax=Neltuma alba TaxID=207710 RepID=UPI0010A48428|nr:DEAD-box ATP-dependent RNA helicase 31-like [Prosopis alba]